ncbi:hypothetical protein B0H14DRAFT_3863671 [Mycena olivaceomarginata]|nr:hypothetical protein B0H14DRAFT_3863671 [Mycena olivaceomarginata]
MLPPFRSTRPPSRPTAPSARRIYSALRAAVLSQLHSSPLICLEAGPREKAGGGVKWMGVFEVRLPHAPRRANLFLTVALRCCRVAPVLRRRESSSHCVYGLGLPACAANPHREHRIPSSLASSRGYLPQSSSRFPMPPRSQFTVSQALLDRPSIAIKASTSSIAYVRSGPRHSEPAAAPYRLRCARCSVPRSNDLRTQATILRARSPSPSQALKLPKSRGRELALATIFPPSVRQSPASSDAPDAFSTVSMPHTTCTATSSAARCPGGYLQHHDSARDPPQGRSTVPSTPTGSTPRRRETQARPALPAARAARDAGVPRRRRRLVAFPHTVTLPQCTAVTDRHLRLPYSPAPPHPLLRAQRVRWSLRIAGTAFIASLRAKCISNKYHSPRSTRAQGACMHDPPRAQHLQQPLPIPRATAFISLPAATVFSASLFSALSQLLSGTGSTMRSIAGVCSKCNELSPSLTPPSSPPRAPHLSSAPTPAPARNLGLPHTADRTGTISHAQHTLQLSPHRPIPSPLPSFILSPIRPAR